MKKLFVYEIKDFSRILFESPNNGLFILQILLLQEKLAQLMYQRLSE